MMLFLLFPNPISEEKQKWVKHLVHVHRGTAHISAEGILMIDPKQEFRLESLLSCLQNSGFTIEKI